MAKNKAIKITLCSVVMLYPLIANSVTWVSTSRISCAQVCRDKNMEPVVSGKYKNGNNFYVCSANAEGEGYRAGYNVVPNWSTDCGVGWGGEEKFYEDYKCLCK